MKLLLIPGSLRKDSYNKKLLRAVEAHLADKSVDTTTLDLQDFPMPMYDGDLESQSGISESIQALGTHLLNADALIVSTPEYNGSIPGVLKNMVDWVSRLKPMPWPGKHLLLMGASPGALGAVRGLWHTRVPFEVLGCHVYPEMFGLSKAHEAFTPEGRLADPKTLERVSSLVDRFLGHVAR